MSMAERDGWIWYDGKMVPWRDATTHVLTHTLHYGMGVFEGVRAYKTPEGPAVFRLRDHTDRLFRSAQIFGMKIPYSKEVLDAAQLACVRDNKLESCYLRPLVFYGSEAMGVAAKSNPVRVAVAVWPWGAYLGSEALEKGVRVKISSFTHHHPNITMCNAKAVCNYAVSILANQEAAHDGYEEAMLLDPQGFICQGSGENVFIVRDGKLHTPDLSGGALNGITRDTIITFAQELGIPVVERRITRDEIYIADEAFFTGTAAEVTPIRELDNRTIERAGAGQSRPACRRFSSIPSTAAIRRRKHGSRRCDDGRDPRTGRDRGESQGSSGLLPQSADAALVEPSSRVPRHRRSRRSKLPVLRNALPARGRTASGRQALNRAALPAADTLPADHATPGPGSLTSRRRMLIVAPSWVGDAILAEPLVARLRATWGDGCVDVLAPAWCAPVYARMQGIGRIYDSALQHGQVDWAQRRSLARTLSGQGYAQALILPNSWKSALVPWLAGIPRRTGYRGEMRWGIVNDLRRLDRHAMPRLVERYAALAAGPGEATAPAPAPILNPDPANRDAAVRALDLRVEGGVAILCPGAEFGPAKRWPPDYFADLARRFLADGLAVWLLGSPKDRPATDAVLAAAGAAGGAIRDLSGRTDLGTAIDLLSLASIVVSNDSGLMHAAAAVGAPLVALFGSSSPEYTPPMSATARIARIDIACSPCFKRECPLGHFKCMRDLAPPAVYDLARAALRPRVPVAEKRPAQ